MRTLISVVLVLFGISVMIVGGIELYTAGEETADWPAQLSHTIGAIVGAGLVIAGPAFGRRLAWGKPLAIFNLVAMAVLSVLNALNLVGHVHATHHATRVLLALFLILTILRHRDPDAHPPGDGG